METGKRVLANRFSIIEEIGSSFSTTTYKAVQYPEEIEVSIHEFFPAHMARRDNDGTIVSLSGQEQFLHEGLEFFLSSGNSICRLRHRNTVDNISCFMENSTGYLVSLSRAGATWQDVLTPLGNTLPENLALRIAIPIIDAMQAAHELEIYHLALSPRNIFMEKGGAPFILTFSNAEVELARRTGRLADVVIPGYSPPEMYDPNGSLGPWSDTYGVSACVYRLLVGSDPPPADERLVSDPLDQLLEVAAVKPELKYVVRRGMSLEPSERPRSMQALREAILACFSDAEQTLLLSGLSVSTGSTQNLSRLGMNGKSPRQAPVPPPPKAKEPIPQSPPVEAASKPQAKPRKATKKATPPPAAKPAPEAAAPTPPAAVTPAPVVKQETPQARVAHPEPVAQSTAPPVPPVKQAAPVSAPPPTYEPKPVVRESSPTPPYQPAPPVDRPSRSARTPDIPRSVDRPAFDGFVESPSPKTGFPIWAAVLATIIAGALVIYYFLPERAATGIAARTPATQQVDVASEFDLVLDEARTLFEAGDLDRAMERVQVAKGLDPTSNQATRLEIRIQADQQRIVKQQQAADLVDRGHAASKEGRPRRARDLYEQALDLDPERGDVRDAIEQVKLQIVDADARADAARAEREREDRQAAAAPAPDRRAEPSPPRVSPEQIAFNQARAEGERLLAEGNLDAALERFEDAARIQPSNGAINRQVSGVQARIEEREAAAKQAAFDELVADGSRLHTGGRHREAIAKLQEAEALVPGNGTVSDLIALAERAMAENSNIRDKDGVYRTTDVQIRQLDRAAWARTLVYPQSAKNANVEGVVTAKVLVGESGEVLRSDIIAGPDFGMHAALQRALQSARFTPPTFNGSPVTTWTQVSASFGLREE